MPFAPKNSTQPTIIAIDTSTEATSVALWVNNKTYNRHEITPQQHAHRVLACIDEVLEEANLEGNQVDVIAFGEGPGAFTGVRIACGVAQGLALGWGASCLGINTLNVMAAQAGHCFEPTTLKASTSKVNRGMVLLDARMNEVYCLEFSWQLKNQILSIEPLSEVELLAPDVLSTRLADYKENHSSLIGLGDIASNYPSLVAYFDNWADALPEATSMIKLAQQKNSAAQTLENHIPTPLYLRNKVADTLAERAQKRL